jgi:hypothetical protein
MFSGFDTYTLCYGSVGKLAKPSDLESVVWEFDSPRGYRCSESRLIFGSPILRVLFVVGKSRICRVCLFAVKAASRPARRSRHETQSCDLDYH